jgi:hypothetical protein
MRTFASNEKCRYWNYDLNEKWPIDVMAGSHKEYWFDCPCGHTFEMKMLNVSHNHWCPYCTTGARKTLCSNECESCHAREPRSGARRIKSRLVKSYLIQMRNTGSYATGAIWNSRAIPEMSFMETIGVPDA